MAESAAGYLDERELHEVHALIDARTAHLADAVLERVARTVRMAVPDARIVHLHIADDALCVIRRVLGWGGRPRWEAAERASQQRLWPARELLGLVPAGSGAEVWGLFGSLDHDVAVLGLLLGRSLAALDDEPGVYELALPRLRRPGSETAGHGKAATSGKPDAGSARVHAAGADAASDDAAAAQAASDGQHADVEPLGCPKCAVQQVEIVGAFGHDLMGHKIVNTLIRFGWDTRAEVSATPSDELVGLPYFGPETIVRIRSAVPYARVPTVGSDEPDALCAAVGRVAWEKLSGKGLTTRAQIRALTGNELGTLVGKELVARVRRTTGRHTVSKTVPAEAPATTD